MGIQIRLGKSEDINALAQLYDELNDYLEDTTNYPGWKKGVYPVREDAEAGVREGSLYVSVSDDQVIGSMILRHKQEDAYKTVSWGRNLDDNKVLVIYTFVVSPHSLHEGVGTKLLAFAAEYAKETDMKALRLDVYEKNLPAISLYQKCGFNYIDTVSLGLEHYGLDWFCLYEKLI